MDSSDLRKIEKQLEETNYKIDQLSKLVNTMCNDGSRRQQQLNEIMVEMRDLSSELGHGEVKAISYRVENLKRSLESMQRLPRYGTP